jgi:hypothetical protein
MFADVGADIAALLASDRTGRTLECDNEWRRLWQRRDKLWREAASGYWSRRRRQRRVDFQTISRRDQSLQARHGRAASSTGAQGR